MSSLFDKNGIWEANEFILLDAKNLQKAVSFLKKSVPNCTKIGISSESVKIDFPIDFQLITNNFPHITDFWVHTELHKDTDISPLYALQNLQMIEWWTKTPLVTSRFVNLKTLSVIYPEIIDFQGNKINNLSISDIKNLDFLSDLPHINTLTIRNFKAENLLGIERAKNLEKLTIMGAKKLIGLDGIGSCKSLKALTLEHINKDVDLSSLANSEISEIYLHLSIDNCQFVQQMEHLNTFLCKEIKNNDLSPLFESKTLQNAYLYKYKKSYNYPESVFKQRFSW